MGETCICSKVQGGDKGEREGEKKGEREGGRERERCFLA